MYLGCLITRKVATRDRPVHSLRHVQLGPSICLCTRSVTDLAQGPQAGVKQAWTKGTRPASWTCQESSKAQTPVPGRRYLLTLHGTHIPTLGTYPTPPRYPPAVHCQSHAVGTRCSGRSPGLSSGTARQGPDYCQARARPEPD